jgi:hypothetical protein
MKATRKRRLTKREIRRDVQQRERAWSRVRDDFQRALFAALPVLAPGSSEALLAELQGDQIRTRLIPLESARSSLLGDWVEPPTGAIVAVCIYRGLAHRLALVAMAPGSELAS